MIKKLLKWVSKELSTLASNPRPTIITLVLITTLILNLIEIIKRLLPLITL